MTTQLTTEFELMQKEQTNDNSISVDRTWLDKGERPSRKEVNNYGVVVKTYWSQFNRLSVENGTVCTKWFEKGKVTILQVTVRKEMKCKILRYCHDVKTGKHFDVRKTLLKVRNC